MTIEAVLLVIAGGGSRSPNSTSAGLIFRGLGAEIYITFSDKKRKKMSVSVGHGHVCPTGRRVRQLPAASEQ